MTTDPLQHQAHADLAVQRAADQLRDLLKTVAAAIDPFPEFPGSFFSYGIEVDPQGELGGDAGCVILAEDGELYELQIGLDPEQAASGDPVAMRSEQRLPLDLPPATYVAYAHRAVTVAVEYLERQAPGA